MDRSLPHTSQRSADPRAARRGRSSADGRLARPSLPHLGWAPLLTWVFCTFYLHSLTASLARPTLAVPNLRDASLASGLVHAGMPLAFSVLTLVVVVLCERRLKSLVGHRLLTIACPALTTVGTLCIAVPAGGAAGEALFWIGALLTGIGSGPLWIMWGELYSTLEQGTAETTAAFAAALAMACALLCVSLTGWVAVAVVALLPVASGCALSRAQAALSGAGTPSSDAAPWSRTQRDRVRSAHEQARQKPLDALRAFGREGFGILVASAVVCYAGSFAANEQSLGLQQLALVFAFALGLAMAAVGILTPRRFNLQFLYRWMCPFVLACLAVLVWLPGSQGDDLAFVGSIGSRLAFCLLTQVYFARIAGEGRFTPLQAFGLGWISLHLGDLLGVALYVSMAHLAPGFVESPSCILALGLALVTAVMFALNGERTFAEAGRRGHGGADATASPAGNPSGPNGLDGSPTAHAAESAAGPSLEDKAARIARDNGLTARELEVLVLLAQGRSNPYIRDALGISLDTASTHVKHVYAKLNVHARQELIDLVRGER